MKTVALAACIALSICSHAEENALALVALLGSDDFDARSKATEKLSLLDEKHIEPFLKLSKSHEDPEVRERLVIAARGIFDRKVAVRDDRWLEMYGTLGIEWEGLCGRKPAVEGETEEYGMVGGKVTFVSYEGDAADKIKGWDVLLEIGGVSVGSGQDSKVLAGLHYRIKLRRYKNTEQISNDAFDPDDKDYEEMTVSVKAGWKDERLVSKEERQALLDKLWKDFRTPSAH